MSTDSAPWASHLPPSTTGLMGDMQVSCTASFGTDTSRSYADWLEQKARQWILDHPAETVAQLVENGEMKEECGLCGCKAEEHKRRNYTCGDYEPAYVYRVSLPTKGDDDAG